jgi:hypothetical protein
VLTKRTSVTPTFLEPNKAIENQIKGTKQKLKIADRSSEVGAKTYNYVFNIYHAKLEWMKDMLYLGMDESGSSSEVTLGMKQALKESPHCEEWARGDLGGVCRRA